MINSEGDKMLKNKEQMKDEMYTDRVEFLQEISPLNERKLFPLPCDGVKVFPYDLSIARLEKIKITGVRKLLKKYDITEDVDEIKEKLYNYYTEDLDSFVTPFEEEGDEDKFWLNILNNEMYEKYGVKIINYHTLFIQAENARMNSNQRNIIIERMARLCYKYKSHWDEVLQFKKGGE